MPDVKKIYTDVLMSSEYMLWIAGLCGLLGIAWIIAKRRYQLGALQRGNNSDGGSFSLDPDDEKLPTIKITELPAKTRMTSAGVSVVGKSSEALLHLIPESVDLSKPALYKLVLPKELAGGIRTGALHLAPSKDVAGGYRLLVTNGHHIQGHGTIVKAGKAAKIASASFQVVSFAVGQAHLQDISQKLFELEEGLKDVREYLEEGTLADIRGNQKYMEQVAKSVLSGELDEGNQDRIWDQLETIDREFLKIGEAIRIRLHRRLASLNDVPLDKPMRSIEKDHENVMEAVEQLRRVMAQAGELLYARGCLHQLMMGLPVQEELLSRRRKNLDQALKAWQEEGASTLTAVNRKVKQLTGALTGKAKKQKLQSEARQSARGFIRKVNERLEATVDNLATTAHREKDLIQRFSEHGLTFEIRAKGKGEKPEILLLDS